MSCWHSAIRSRYWTAGFASFAILKNNYACPNRLESSSRSFCSLLFLSQRCSHYVCRKFRDCSALKIASFGGLRDVGS
jgi:hypothetical protein